MYSGAKTSFLTTVFSIESKLGLNDESDAEETRVLTENSVTKRPKFFRSFLIFL